MISISDALILTSLLCIIVTVYGTLQQPTQYLLRPEMTVSSELETFTVDNERLCGARCEVLEACESYSVVDDESGEYTCILHDKNGLDRPASVTGLENSTLYDLYKPGDSVQKFLDGCRDVICENDGKCLTDPTDVMSYKCACHGSYHGPHCEIKYDEEPVIMQEIPIRAGFNVVHFRCHGYDHLVYSSVDCGETITIYRRLETDADANFVMWHTIPAFICSQMIEVLEIGGATYILSSGAGGVFDSQMNEITDGGPVPVSNTQWAVSMNAPHTSKSIQSTVIDNDILLTISQHGSVAAKTVRISGESPTLVDSIELPGVTCETPALFEADNDIYQILYCNPVDSIASRVYKLTGTNTWELHQELGNNGRQWYTYEQRGRRYVLSSGMHSGSSCELPDNIALYLWDPYLKVLVKKNAITSPCVSWLKIFTLGDETMIIATRERESLDLSFTTDPITTIVYKIDGYRIEKQAELNGAATKRADGFLGVDGVYLALTHNQGRDAGDETAATITVYKWV